MTSSRQLEANHFDVTSAVERELVLRPASLLWRLRRATTIESGAGAARAMTKNGHPSLRCPVKTN